MLIAMTFGHELAHALTAKLLGYKIKYICLGIPLKFVIFGKSVSTVIFDKKWRGVSYQISWLFMGGAVDFYDMENIPFWKNALICLAGPISNALMAFLAIMIVAGPTLAVSVFSMLTDTILKGLGFIAEGTVPLTQIGGPVMFMTASTSFVNSFPGNLGYLIVWSLFNVGLFVTNLIPFPALDGGQVMTSLVVAIVGEKAKKPVKVITYCSLYILCGLMLIVMAKDLLLLM